VVAARFVCGGFAFGGGAGRGGGVTVTEELPGGNLADRDAQPSIKRPRTNLRRNLLVLTLTCLVHHPLRLRCSSSSFHHRTVPPTGPVVCSGQHGAAPATLRDHRVPREGEAKTAWKGQP
jgi:hypothetical protein